jgi:hypothetical protein
MSDISASLVGCFGVSDVTYLIITHTQDAKMRALVRAGLGRRLDDGATEAGLSTGSTRGFETVPVAPVLSASDGDRYV